MEKIQNFYQRLATFLLKETFLVNPTLTNFTQTKKKRMPWCSGMVSIVHTEQSGRFPNYS